MSSLPSITLLSFHFPSSFSALRSPPSVPSNLALPIPSVSSPLKRVRGITPENFLSSQLHVGEFQCILDTNTKKITGTIYGYIGCSAQENKLKISYLMLQENFPVGSLGGHVPQCPKAGDDTD
jgi:hypothetical protein